MAVRKPLSMEEFVHRVYNISIEGMLPRDYRKSDPVDLCRELCDEIEILYDAYRVMEAENTRLRIMNL